VKAAESPKISPLFRQAVFAQRYRDVFGATLVPMPVSIKLSLCFTLMIVTSATTLAVVGDFSSKARVTGVTAPEKGLVRVVAPQAGVVTHMAVDEGKWVDAGEALLVTSSSLRRSADGKIASSYQVQVEQLEVRRRQLYAEMRKRLEVAEKAASIVSNRIAAMEHEAKSLQVEQRLQAERVSHAEQELRRYEELRQRGFVTDAVVLQKKDLALEQAAKAQALQRSADSVAKEIGIKRLEIGQIRAQAEVDGWALKQALPGIDREKEQLQTQESTAITAPISGRVTSVSADVGQHLTQGQPVLAIVPDGRLNAVLFVPSNAIGHVAAGQRALLRFAAFPYQRYGLQRGTVIEVSRAPMSPTDPLAASWNAGGKYKVVVRLERQSVVAGTDEQAYVPGMQVEADLLQARRKVYQWMFDPLQALAATTRTQ
jgi:membrane fusion protein